MRLDIEGALVACRDERQRRKPSLPKVRFTERTEPFFVFGDLTELYRRFEAARMRKAARREGGIADLKKQPRLHVIQKRL